MGIAGWAYKDWEGIVYPPGMRPKETHPLEYLAQYFDVVEINTGRKVGSISVPGVRCVSSYWRQ